MRVLIPSMLLVMAAVGAAQTEPTPMPALASSASDDQHYGWEDPELWGARAVEAIPEDAALLVDYEVAAGQITQRLRLYSDGYVRAEWDQPPARIDRSLQLSADAATEWQKIVDDFTMPVTSYRPSSRLSNENNHAAITIVRGGKPETHSFSTAAALPAALGTLRSLLDSLADAVVQDRQVTNPLSTYAPVVGDVLVDPEGHEFRVSRVLSSSRMVELRRHDFASTTWVPQRDLYTMFVSVIRGGTSPK